MSSDSATAPDRAEQVGSRRLGSEAVQPAGTSRVPSSCLPDLDALWFCYSPVYQFRYYYMNGTVDSCVGKVRRLVRCFRSRLVSSDEAARMYENAVGKDDDDGERHGGLGAEVCLPPTAEPVWALRPPPPASPPQPSSEVTSEDAAPSTG
ncbi:hypothetical protein CCYA_CCYA18G4528 [Cyanidiococcus yangmingshanensis]|nr:hypothetical protein CCYA_CCYA18G4528 [Cyanidiococcus yangmingshanensis]